MINNLKEEGFIITLSSPSGGGKSSICNALLRRDDKLKLSISTTTRKPRAGEVDGADYYFKTKEEFDALVKQDMFIEYARIYDNYYGTLKAPLEQNLKSGFDMLFDIDCQGMRSIKSKMPEVVTIFILPPTIEVLRDRLKSRGQDCHGTIESRMKQAIDEINHAPEYDYVIINDKFEHSITKVKSIIIAERIKRSRSYKLLLFSQPK
jgi:guanylate kinase